MLSRSSLETQKLELMSAMSELKLQQAALERENLELRTSHLNNNSIPPRRPPVPGRILTTNSSPLNTTPLHGSHNNLPNSTSTNPFTPKVMFLPSNTSFKRFLVFFQKIYFIYI